MTGIADGMWWSRFKELVLSGSLSAEVNHYIEYSEDYYIAEKKGEAMLKDERNFFVQCFNQENEIEFSIQPFQRANYEEQNGLCCRT